MTAPNPLLQKYIALRNSVISRLDPSVRAKYAAQFDADPRVQKLRQAAGLAPVSTTQQGVQQVAKQSIASRVSNLLGAAEAGGESALASIPTHIRAAADYYLPRGSNSLGDESQVPQAKSYSDQLALERQANAQAQARSPTGSVIGQVLGSGVGLSLAGKVIGAGAARLAATEAPVIAPVANFLQNLGTLQKGQIIRNTARAATIGGAVGGAQAAGEGNDIKTGAEVGAGTAGVLQGGSSIIGKFLLRPAVDMLGLSNPGAYLKRFTSATVDEIKQKVADFRAQTGADPTLFQVLPLQDRNNLIKNTVAGRDPIVEQASQAIKDRTANVQPEMQDVVQGATQGERLKTQRAMVSDLTTANGGTPVPGDNALALRASQSPTEMLRLRRVESQRIMAPHDETQVVPNASDLIPQYPVTDSNGTITMREVNPEISRAINAVSGGMSLRPQDAGVNVKEVTDMVSQLREAAGEGDIVNRSAANAAANHLMGVLDQNVPEAARATQQMRSAYAAHSRMAEGMGEGWQSRLADNIQTGTSNSRAQSVDNAYNTDEGVAGRQLGQTNQIQNSLSGSPESAVKATVDLARNGNPAIPENLGQNAGDQIQTAAQAQTQGVENLSSALQQAKSGEGNALSSEDLGRGLLALSPHTFVTTKFRFLHDLMNGTFMPEAKARVVADMLFSQDPGLTDKAVNLLNQSTQGRSLQAGLMASLTAANTATSATAPDPALASQNANLIPVAASSNEAPATPAAPANDPYAGISAPAPTAEAPATPAAPANDPYASISSAAPGQPADSPYAGKLASIYAQENPQVVSLMQRVKNQESHGDQKAVSNKGAIGTMQVMPDTAPEAAKLAGVPWDPKAYKSDGAYNEILGHAYLAQQLRKYNGNVGQALAAYNAGPGAVDTALSTHGDNWLTAVPAETQDYVARVGS